MSDGLPLSEFASAAARGVVDAQDGLDALLIEHGAQWDEIGVPPLPFAWRTVRLSLPVRWACVGDRAPLATVAPSTSEGGRLALTIRLVDTVG